MRKKRWSFKDVVIGKTMLVIIVTIIGSIIINYVVNWLLRIAAEAKGKISFIQITKPVSFIFVIPAFLIGVSVIQLILNVKAVPDNVKKSGKITADTEKKFKWHIAYSLVLGYILLCALMFFVRLILNKVAEGFTGDLSFKSVFADAMVLILTLTVSIVIAIAFTKRFNKKMCEITKTNEGLLQALYNGELESEIPVDLQNPEAMQGIINILQKPAATTLRGAIAEYRILCKLRSCAEKSAKIAFVIGIIMMIITLGVMNQAMLEMSDGIRGLGAEICDGIDSSRALSAAASVKKQYNNALFQGKRKAEDEAVFKARRAAEQLNYNPNTYEAQKRVNEARQAAAEAQKAAQNFYNNKL